jgi:opacity protein-like surface antigen
MYRGKGKLQLSLLLSGLVLGVGASGQSLAGEDLDLGYRYIEFGYMEVDYDDVLPGVNADGEGGGVSLSLPLHPNVHLIAGYSDLNLDFDVDVTGWQAGLGYNHAIADKTDIVMTVAYVDAEAKSSGITVDDSGYALGVGFRHMIVNDSIRASVLEGIELNGNVSYVDLDDSGDETGLALGALFHFNSVFSVGIEGLWGDDTTGYMAGVRLSF